MATRLSSSRRSPSPVESNGMPKSSLSPHSASTEQLMASLSEEQVHVQKRTFGRWVNYFLRQHKPPCHVGDLIEGLQDGSKLLALLEVLSGERLTSEKGNKRPHHLANVGAALKFLTGRNVKLVNVHRESVVDGNETIILGLTWAIIHHYQVKGLYANKGKARTKKYLLEWCRKAAEKATGTSENLKDFSSSWKNGQAFLQIIHAFRPDLVDLSITESRDNVGNLKEAFDLAEKHLNVPRLLEPEDVDVEKPDERSIVTYVATLYDKLEVDLKKKSSKRPASPTKTTSKKSLSPEPGDQSELKKTSSKTNLSGKGGEGKARSSSSTTPAKQLRSASSSPSSPRKQKGESGRSTSPKDQRTPSPSPPSGNAKFKGSQSKLSGTPTVSPSSSLSEDSMEISSSESNLAAPKRRDSRSTSPTPKSSAPKKPRMSSGKTALSSDHSDRLKSKRSSLYADSKKFGLPSYHSDSSNRKRGSFSGSLTSLRKLSSASSTPMDVESSSSELEDSQKQIQIFRQQIQRREFHINRVIETKYPQYSLPEDKLHVLVTKWEIVKHKVTVLEEKIWEVGRHVSKDGKFGNLLLWLHEAESLLNYYETEENWICEVPPKFLLKQHETFFKDLDEHCKDLDSIVQSGDNEDVVMDASLFKELDDRIKTVREKSSDRRLRLAYENSRSKILLLLEAGRKQLISQPVKFTSLPHVEKILREYTLFFLDKKFLKRCKKYHRSLHEAGNDFMDILPESRTMEVKNVIWNVDQQVDKISDEVTSRLRHIEELNKKWKTFDTLMESVGKWMEDAEGLIKNGTLKACKEYLKDVEKIQSDVSTAQDCSKTILAHCQDRKKSDMSQLLRDVDRRLKRIIRRHSRIMKCDKRNSKLEQFEETVDGVMDWIYDAEVFGSCTVEGTYEAVKERTEKLEVTQREIEYCESNVNSLNRLTKAILKDFKTDMTSSINATLSNINRRFEKIKASVPHRYWQSNRTFLMCFYPFFRKAGWQ